MGYLLGLLVAALTAFFYQKQKTNSAEALLTNLKTKEKLNELSELSSKNEGLVEAKKEQLQELDKELNNLKKKGASDKELLDFFNQYPFK